MAKNIADYAQKVAEPGFFLDILDALVLADTDNKEIGLVVEVDGSIEVGCAHRYVVAGCHG